MVEETWGPSRRRRLHAWRPDQVVLGLLGVRCSWLREEPLLPPLILVMDHRAPNCMPVSFCLCPSSLVVLGLRFLEARGQCALE